MKQPDKRTPFLFITLGIVAILLLLIAQGIVDKIKKAGDTGIFFVDSQLGQR